jgi:hypothetical protein
MYLQQHMRWNATRQLQEDQQMVNSYPIKAVLLLLLWLTNNIGKQRILISQQAALQGMRTQPLLHVP